MAAEAQRIEAAIAARARAASCSTSAALASDHRAPGRTPARLARRRARRGLLIGGPDGLDATLKATRRRDAAPVGPDAAARLRARAAGRGAVPRLVAAAGPPLPPRMKPAPPSFIYLASQSPRRSQLLQQIGVDAPAAAARCRRKMPRRWKRSRAGELPDGLRAARHAAEAGRCAAAAGAARACRRRRCCAPTPRWRWAGASWASRPMRPRPAPCCARCRAAPTAC